MTFTEIALRMFPYWLMGLLMMFAVWNSQYKELLRVQPKSVLKWVGFLALLTIYRVAMFKIFSGNQNLHDMTSGAATIPWQATFTVFWEDACHGLPLAIMSMRLGSDKLWKRILMLAAIVLVSLSFGLGHVYQGYVAAFFLSFYVPFSYRRGQEIGFGTIMICHTLYDLSTILTIKHFLG